MARRDEIVAFADRLLDVGKWQEFGRRPAGRRCRRGHAHRLRRLLVARALRTRGEERRGPRARASRPLLAERAARRRSAAAAAARSPLRCRPLAARLSSRARRTPGGRQQRATRPPARHRPDRPSPASASAAGSPPRSRSTSSSSRPRRSNGSRTSSPRDRPHRARRGLDRCCGPRPDRSGTEGYDCFVTGEPEEPSLHAARELGIHLIAAGHHATERLGYRRSRGIGDRFDSLGVHRGREPSGAGPLAPRSGLCVSCAS